MYAPLALNLKFVYGKRLVFRSSNLLFLRAPVVQKTATLTTTTRILTRRSSKLYSGAVAGGVIGGVTILLIIGTIALLEWCQRRQSHRRTSVGSSLSFVFERGHRRGHAGHSDAIRPNRVSTSSCRGGTAGRRASEGLAATVDPPPVSSGGFAASVTTYGVYPYRFVE